MDKQPALCNQCGKVIELSGFYLQFEQGMKHFCCEGCLSIYQLVCIESVSKIIVGGKNESL
ncbi:MAG: metal-binding protein [Methylomonas sp.]